MPKVIKGLAELIEESGVDPTEWEFRRLAKNIQMVDEYREFVDSGAVPPDLVYLSLKEARIEVKALEDDLMKLAQGWREYRLAKRRALDATVDGDMSLSLVDVLKARSERVSSTDRD